MNLIKLFVSANRPVRHFITISDSKVKYLVWRVSTYNGGQQGLSLKALARLRPPLIAILQQQITEYSTRPIFTSAITSDH
jgi:hypothetical protein